MAATCAVDGCDEPRFTTRAGRPYGLRCKYHHYAGATVTSDGQRVPWEPDELSRTIDAEHVLCVAAGGCEYGEDVVVRPGRSGHHRVELRTCVRCGVPEPPPTLSGAGRNAKGSPFAGVIDEDG